MQSSSGVGLQSQGGPTTRILHLGVCIRVPYSREVSCGEPCLIVHET